MMFLLLTVLGISGDTLMRSNMLHMFGTTRFRMGATIDNISIDSKGQRLLCQSRHGSVALLDIEGTELKRFSGALGQISPDGRHVAFLAPGLGVVAVALESMKKSAFPKEVTAVYNLSISPRNLLAVAWKDHVSFWQIGEKTVLFEVSVPNAFRVAFSKDGSKLAAAAMDGTHYLIDLETRKIIWSVLPQESFVSKLQFVGERQFVSFGTDGVAILDILDRSTKVVATKRRGKLVGSITKDEQAIVMFEEGMCCIFDTMSGKRRYHKLKEEINCVESINRDTVVCGGADGILFFCSLKQGQFLFHQKDGYSGVGALAVSEQHVAFGSKDGQVVFSQKNSTAIRLHTLGASVTSLSINKKANLIAAGTKSGQVVFFELASGNRIFEIQQQRSPKKLVLLSGTEVLMSADNVICSLEVPSGRVRAVFSHENTVTDFDVSPDGKKMVCCIGDHPGFLETDKAIVVWNLKSRKIEADGKLEGVFHSCVFSVDANKVFLGGQRLAIFDFQQRSCSYRHVLSGGDVIGAMAVSQDGKTLAIGSWQGVVCTLDIESGKVQTHGNHLGQVNHVGLRNDEVYSASDDTTVVIWRSKN